MNYLPFCGFWFYGGTSAEETASFYDSYGLLALAPIPPTGGGEEDKALLRIGLHISTR